VSAASAGAGICPRCARRARLLAQLEAPLRGLGRDPARLWAALALGDEELIDALGGKAGEGSGLPLPALAICRHHCAYPGRLAGEPLAPHVVTVGGAVERLRRCASWTIGDPVDPRSAAGSVAIVGAASCSDYGARSARLLAEGLAGAGVTLVCAEDATGTAVRAGALRAVGGGVLVVGADGADCADARARTPPESAAGGRKRSPERLGQRECRLGELLPGADSPWRRLASLRTLALLADLLVVVEAGEHGAELACAELARTREAPIAAVPGPIDSPLSRGTGALLDEGARPALSAELLLDALAGVGRGSRARRPRRARRRPPARDPTMPPASHPTRLPANHPASPPAPQSTRPPAHHPAGPPAEHPADALEPRLAGVLARVSGGQDTLAALCAGERDCEQTAVALAELELLGLLQRTADGRYAAGVSHLP
jgi:predicted Rossmann fold nucleotide-binding protein DprA/Smf involved in DNA uptake